MKQVRQGDVLLDKVEAIPEGAVKRTLNNLKDRLLVHGEAANHAHFATGNVDVLEHDGELYLEVMSDSQLEHLLMDTGVWTKEHTEIGLDKGYYKVTRQVEYDPYEATIRQVQD